MPQYIGSSTPLTGSGGATPTYTSRWVSADLASAITGSVFADQAGTLYIEQSGDQVHADVSASYTTTANQGSGFTENIVLPYVRLRFTNSSATAQTSFRLFNRFTLGEMP